MQKDLSTGAFIVVPQEGTCKSGEARLGLAGLNHLSGPGVWGLSLITWYLALG